MTARPHWAQIQEASLLWGMRLLFAVYRLFGHRMLQLFLHPVVLYYWLTNPAARSASRDYLDKVCALRPALNLRGDHRGSYRHLFSFANAIIDKLAAWAGMLSVDDVSYQGRAALQHDLQSGRGALVLVSHLGNVEVCRMLASLEPKLKINVLVHTQHAQKFNHLLSLYNPASTLNLWQVSDINAATAMALAEKIDQGELVIIAADRTPVSDNRRVVVVDFLGAPALLPQGPFILAGLLRCPVYTLFCVKQQDKYAIIFEAFSEALALPRNRREQVIQQQAQSYAQRLQEYCLQYPLQWFNFYDFWRAQ